MVRNRGVLEDLGHLLFLLSVHHCVNDSRGQIRAGAAASRWLQSWRVGQEIFSVCGASGRVTTDHGWHTAGVCDKLDACGCGRVGRGAEGTGLHDHGCFDLLSREGRVCRPDSHRAYRIPTRNHDRRCGKTSRPLERKMKVQRREGYVKRTIAAAAALLLAVLIFSPAADAADSAAIRVGYQPGTAPRFFVAREKKMLEKAGLQPEYLKFIVGPPRHAALQGENIDVAFMTTAPAIFALSRHPRLCHRIGCRRDSSADLNQRGWAQVAGGSKRQADSRHLRNIRAVRIVEIA